jgi:hypothetical protein
MSGSPAASGRAEDPGGLLIATVTPDGAGMTAPTAAEDGTGLGAMSTAGR